MAWRQAVYIEFCKRHNIPDPCGIQEGFKRVIACFIEKLMLDNNSCTATIHGYVEAVNVLFWLRYFDIPANLLDQANLCAKIIATWEKEENIANTQSPIKREMFATLLRMVKNSPVYSLETVVADWFTLIRITGLRCAEYQQKKNSIWQAWVPFWKTCHQRVHPNQLEILK